MLSAILPGGVSHAQRSLDSGLHHLRLISEQGVSEPEWSSFPARPESDALDVRFESVANTEAWCLQLRQQDVKQTWYVLLNDQRLGQLVINENDMVVYFEVPSNSVRDGANQLRIVQDTRRLATDDVRLGECVLHEQPLRQVLGEATLNVIVRDPHGDPLPCRLTLVNERGALQTVWVDKSTSLASRPGIVYTATGEARIHLPAGQYTVSAGRGFEYSLDKQPCRLERNEEQTLALTLSREVPTEGYVACDTHVHSRTHSGHGDATVQERMVTVAGEGIELPIATDHNVHIDHEPFAVEVGVRRFFTPVVGNEVTTRVGHFNVFPVERGARLPNHQLGTYGEILAEIYRTPGVKVAILNHARDLHGGTRPFGPKLHNAVVGENLEAWPLRFNAMEIINSGATQSRPLQLLHDWMGLLNRGLRITPVGSSDSHDVGRHFVGQGRTYIRCDDKDPGNIDVDQAVDSFLQGRVLVSYGLLAELQVEGKYRSGDIAPVLGGEIETRIRVLGPSWVSASHLTLFANGQVIREAELSPAEGNSETPGVLWDQKWTLPAPKHDVHLVAVAVGPGIADLAWPTAKPYQPTTPNWTGQVLGCSGAIWLDVDGDGRPTSARQYAQSLVDAAREKPESILDALADYDAAVAAQAAFLVDARGTNLLSTSWQTAISNSAVAVQTGFQTYLAAWRENQRARSGLD